MFFHATRDAEGRVCAVVDIMHGDILRANWNNEMGWWKDGIENIIEARDKLLKKRRARVR